jgi:predicted amidohydrolase YtcJ
MGGRVWSSRLAGVSLMLCSLIILPLSGCNGSNGSGGGSGGTSQIADSIFFDANVETMNAAQPTAQAVAIKGSQILAVGSDAAVLAHKGANTTVTDLAGATVLPGFIDPHSHLMGYAFFSDTNFWTDVSSVNLYFKPPPSDPRCTTPTNPQLCFIPVQTQDDVIARMQSAAAAALTNGNNAVYAANYDPARLGHGSTCTGPITNVGYQCPNFEDGSPRNDLDTMVSSTIPVFVTSESGHVNYVNTAALTALNICGTDVAVPSTCITPTTNPSQEEALAQAGQLDEDLSFYSTGFFENKIITQAPADLATDITQAVSLYAQHGYTLAQEGAATLGLVQNYLAAIRVDKNFPLTMAMLMYDASSADFSDTVAMAQQARQAIGGNPDIFVAALKSFADGSTQAYTAYLAEPYFEFFLPFTWTVFPQPYAGLPDVDQLEMESRAVTAHQAGYPMVIHQNGDLAISNTLAALQGAQTIFPAPNFRDVVLHAPLIGATNLGIVKTLNDPISFLMEDLYFWGMSVCQQVLGPTLATQTFALYPGADAENAGLRVTLHSDTPVSPPDPLFEIWVAKTRNTQQLPWYPNTNAACPTIANPAMNPNEAMTIAQGIQAFTTNAAWQYGLENQLGAIEDGFTADLAVLSADPLSMESNPDGLMTIQVNATVHHGIYLANPNASQTPIWPG